MWEVLLHTSTTISLSILEIILKPLDRPVMLADFVVSFLYLLTCLSISAKQPIEINTIQNQYDSRACILDFGNISCSDYRKNLSIIYL